MYLDQLLYFSEVIRNHSINKAAQNLHISQPAFPSITCLPACGNCCWGKTSLWPKNRGFPWRICGR